jgi:ubiquitin-protein ligase
MTMGLAKPLLMKRLNNEIETLNDYFDTGLDSIPEDAGFPIILSVCLFNLPAKATRDKETDRHRFDLVISDEYPYERPRVNWRTEIFHPNIMMPEDGGLVCLKISENWNFGSNLISFIIGIENLISAPNPMNPYGTESCVAAAEWYSSNKPKFSAKVSYGGTDA